MSDYRGSLESLAHVHTHTTNDNSERKSSRSESSYVEEPSDDLDQPHDDMENKQSLSTMLEETTIEPVVKSPELYRVPLPGICMIIQKRGKYPGQVCGKSAYYGSLDKYGNFNKCGLHKKSPDIPEAHLAMNRLI